MSTISIDPLPDLKARVRPSATLTDERWDAFQAACRAGGGRMDPLLRQMVAPAGRVGDVIAHLERYSFSVRVHPDVARMVDGKREEAQAEAEQALQRIASVWTGKPLRGFQQTGAAWMAPRRAAMLTDEPGVGKTATVVAALDAGVPVVVICPKVAKATWSRHVQWRSDFSPRVFEGRANFAWPKPGEVFIFNFDILPSSEALEADGPGTWRYSCPPGLVVIVDEAHLAKNRDRKRSKKVRAILNAARDKGGRRWIVTGTPLDNHPPDLWSMIELAGLEEETWRTEEAFRRAFGEGDDEDGQKWSADGVSLDVPKILQRVMLRREKADVFRDMPPKQVDELEVEIPEDTKKIADEAVEALAAVGVDVNEAIDMATLTKKGVVPFELLSRARAALAAAKMDALLELVESLESQQQLTLPVGVDPSSVGLGLAGDKRLRALERAGMAGDVAAQAQYAIERARRDGDLVGAVERGARWADPFLVWSCHRAPIDALAKRAGWTSMTADVSTSKRQVIEDDFQAGLYRGFAATIQAGGVSITLTRAWRAIFVDLPWKPSDLQQAEDRIHRFGQEQPCLYTYLVANHQLDRWLINLLGRKKEIEAMSVRAAAVKAPDVGPPPVPATATVAAAPEDRRPPRMEEGDIMLWLQQSTAPLARALVRQLRREKGLTEAQWLAAARKVRGGG